MLLQYAPETNVPCVMSVDGRGRERDSWTTTVMTVTA